MHNYIFDLEVYPNHFLACFQDVDTNKQHYFTDKNINDLLKFVNSANSLIGYNSLDYDNIIIAHFLQSEKNRNVKSIKALNDKIINDDSFRNTKEYKQLRFFRLPYKSIDLSYYFPKIGSNKNNNNSTKKRPSNNKRFFRAFKSLKELQACLDLKIESLPYDPNKILSIEQKNTVLRYCWNDIESTKKLYDIKKNEIQLRKELDQDCYYDLVNATRPKVAEKYILDKYCKATGLNKNQVYELKQENIPTISTKIPKNLSFKNLLFKNWYQARLNEQLQIDENKRVNLDALRQEIKIDTLNINLGGGGVHGAKNGKYKQNNNVSIVDIDIASYYPNIILNNKLYPEHLGTEFLNIYEGIVNKRLQAKKEGNKAVSDSLKIVINSTFGKLGSPYAWFYEPSLMPSVTVSGQLYLLKLIDDLLAKDFNIIYVNTDGLTIQVNNNRLLELRKIYKQWESTFNFKLEETFFKALYIKDVSNFIAEKQGGDYKVKGKEFASFNATDEIKTQNRFSYPIVTESVVKKLLYGIDIKKTIESCNDINKFKIIQVRDSRAKFIQTFHNKNGSNDNELSKIIRYYPSIDFENGYKIERLTEKQRTTLEGAGNCKIFFEQLSGIPQDLDHAFYISKANTILKKIEGKKEHPDLFNIKDDQPIKQPITSNEPLNLLLDDDNYYFVVRSGEPIQKAVYNFKNNLLTKDQIIHNKSDLEYITVNPFNINAQSKKQANIKYITCLTIECDPELKEDSEKEKNKAKRKQQESFKLFGRPNVLIDSGNKSLHGVYRFKTPITEKQLSFASELIQKIFRVPKGQKLDIGVLKDCSKLIRLAGGTRKNGKIQEAKLLNKVPFDYDEFIEDLKNRLPEQEVIEIQSKINAPQELANQEKFNFILNRIKYKLIEKGFSYTGYLYKGKDYTGVLFKNFCPVKKHRQNKKTDFAIILHDSGKIITSCVHESCKEDKYSPNSKQAYTLLKLKYNIDTYALYKDYEHFKQEQESRRVELEKLKCQAKKLKKYKSNTTIEEQLKKNCTSQGVLNLTANTGVGKTVTTAKIISKLITTGEKCIYSTKNKTLMNQFTLELFKQNIQKKDILLLEKDSEIDTDEINNYKVIVTHYEYLQRKGNSFSLYNKLVNSIDSRHVFIDECDNLLRMVNYPLSAAYRIKNNSEGFIKLSKCLKSCPAKSLTKAKKDDPCNCEFIFKEHSKIEYHCIKKYYVPEITAKGIDDYKIKDSGELIEQAHKFNNYKQIDKTLFAQAINEDIKPCDTYFKEISEQEHTDTSKNKYIETLRNHLVNPHFTLNMPIHSKTKSMVEDCTFLNDVELKAIQYPQEPCKRPCLVGYDITPLFILKGVKLGNTSHAGAKSVTFMSATESSVLNEALGKIFDNVEEIGINHIKAKFDIDLLKTSKPLSNKTIIKILAKLTDEGNKNILLFAKTKNEAKEIYNKLHRQTKNKTKVKLFVESDYKQNISSVEYAESKSHTIITYSKSSIARGYNFKEFDLILLDANAYLPKTAIFLDNIEHCDKKTIERKQLEYIKNQLIQNVGRILRTTKEFKQGEIVQDDIKKSIVLYNLPKNLSHFVIDKNLLYEKRIYSGNWIDNKSNVDEIYNQIVKSLNRETLKDFGNNTKNKKADSKKVENKRNNIRKKIVELKKQGFKKDKIKSKINYYKLDNEIQKYLKKFI